MTSTATVTDVSLNTPPKTIYRLDYTPPIYTIVNTELYFKLDIEHTEVRSSLSMKRVKGGPADLVLDGDSKHMTLQSISINGQDIPLGQVSISDHEMTIPSSLLPPEDVFLLGTVVTHSPKDNLKLMGLYASGDLLCTQCEADGFRRITYFLDRPDVLSMFKVHLECKSDKFSVLISNGNRISDKITDGVRVAVFEDPHPKPCYLFALVAGNLHRLEDTFTTSEGTVVDLHIYTELSEPLHRLEWSMHSLKEAMKWDEDRFGLSYDLDVFSIVAVRSFNMGAMENKSLNIFLSSLILASPEMTTDSGYASILGVVGHEYFHNWTGNRVTCRDWFQLTLKEGLTVFRDQTFSSEVTESHIKRIEDVVSLRTRQFKEDSGPVAHSIRPDSYISMENLYTSTVYDKGAEVIRMMSTMAGREGFRKGMDLYFERHDGTAVTCDDFKQAIQDGSGVDLSLFDRWYSQKGTPTVTVQNKRIEAGGVYVASVSQTIQEGQSAFPIPLRYALFDIETKDIVGDGLMVFNQMEDDLKIKVPGTVKSVNQYVLSVNREFSAPVIVRNIPPEGVTDSSELRFLMAYDKYDAFTRFDAANSIATQFLLRRVEKVKQGGDLLTEKLQEEEMKIFKTLLQDALIVLNAKTDVPKHLPVLADILRLPLEESLSLEVSGVHPKDLRDAILSTKKEVVAANKAEMESLYSMLTPASTSEYEFNTTEVAKRSFRNVLLSYLRLLDTKESKDLTLSHLKNASCMTDSLAGYFSCMHSPDELVRTEASNYFYEKFKDNQIALDKWFAGQAYSQHESCLQHVVDLQSHEAFDWTVPPRVRSLLGAFVHNGPMFHTPQGYAIVENAIRRLDAFNPIIASRFADALIHWKRFPSETQELAINTIRRLLEAKDPKLSPDAFEILSKGLP